MTEWLRGNELEKRSKAGDLGGTMRLGAYPATLTRGSRVSEIYGGATEISERHRHRYEVNTAYKDRLEQQACGFRAFRPMACCRRSSNTRIIPGSSGCNSIPN